MAEENPTSPHLLRHAAAVAAGQDFSSSSSTAASSLCSDVALARQAARRQSLPWMRAALRQVALESLRDDLQVQQQPSTKSPAPEEDTTIDTTHRTTTTVVVTKEAVARAQASSRRLAHAWSRQLKLKGHTQAAKWIHELVDREEAILYYDKDNDSSSMDAIRQDPVEEASDETANKKPSTLTLTVEALETNATKKGSARRIDLASLLVSLGTSRPRHALGAGTNRVTADLPSTAAAAANNLYHSKWIPQKISEISARLYSAHDNPSGSRASLLRARQRKRDDTIRKKRQRLNNDNNPPPSRPASTMDYNCRYAREEMVLPTTTPNGDASFLHDVSSDAKDDANVLLGPLCDLGHWEYYYTYLKQQRDGAKSISKGSFSERQVRSNMRRAIFSRLAGHDTNSGIPKILPTRMCRTTQQAHSVALHCHDNYMEFDLGYSMLDVAIGGGGEEVHPGDDDPSVGPCPQRELLCFSSVQVVLKDQDLG